MIESVLSTVKYNCVCFGCFVIRGTVPVAFSHIKIAEYTFEAWLILSMAGVCQALNGVR